MEEIRNFDIYKATNKLNNKYYIGVTTQGVGARMKKHLYKALSGSQYNFHKALAELGLEQFTVEVVDSTDDLEKAKELEKFWIEKLHSNNSEYGYNSDCGGDIMFHTDETKAKISAVHKGKDQSSRYKAVLQYDCDGNFIQEFPSLTHASDFTGICRASLIRGLKHVFKGKSKVNPFIWVYKEEYPDIPKKIDKGLFCKDPNYKHPLSENFLIARGKNLFKDGKTTKIKKAVRQYDLNGNLLNEFESISEASKITNVSNTTIRDYCNGKFDEKLKDPKFLKKIKYIWKYKE